MAFQPLCVYVHVLVRMQWHGCVFAYIFLSASINQCAKPIRQLNTLVKINPQYSIYKIYRHNDHATFFLLNDSIEMIWIASYIHCGWILKPKFGVQKCEKWRKKKQWKSTWISAIKFSTACYRCFWKFVCAFVFRAGSFSVFLRKADSSKWSE